MRVEVLGTGEGISELANVEDLPVEIRDPVRMFVNMLNAGFAIFDKQLSWSPDQHPVSVSAAQFDEQHKRYRWQIELPEFLHDHLLIVRNLLNMRGIDATFNTIEVRDRDFLSKPLSLADVEYPRFQEIIPFEFRVDLDEQLPIRGCMIYIQYRSPLEKERARQLCDRFATWGNVAMCGGFTPPGVNPGKAGTFFSGAFQHDSSTVALEFEEFFSIDFASFDLIKSFLIRDHFAGNPVIDVVIE
jgi:hypothetical protein